MFTLEDMDLSTELEYFRAHGSEVLASFDLDGEDTPPEANARLHPSDYFIAGA